MGGYTSTSSAVEVLQIESYVIEGTTLSPGEMKALVFSIRDIPRGEYVLKLTTKSGYQCVSNVVI